MIRGAAGCALPGGEVPRADDDDDDDGGWDGIGYEGGEGNGDGWQRQ